MTKTSSNWLTDGYVRRARTYPSVIVAVPFIPFIGYVFGGSWFAAVPLVIVAALAFAANEIVRDRGLAVQKRLLSVWDGMPTTRQLRFRSTESATIRSRKRAAVEALTGRVLPTLDDETRNPAEADEEYNDAVGTAIAIVRAGHLDSDLLDAESASYGFRRNTRGLKPFGLATTVGAAVGGLAILIVFGPSTIVAVALALAVLLGVFWLLVVTDRWVTAQTENYARRFFIVVQNANTNNT